MLKQISIYAENKKGAMQNITKILLDNQINILGSVTNDSAEYGIVRMVVSDPETACKALNDNDYLCRMVNVIGVEITTSFWALSATETSVWITCICPLTANPANRLWYFTRKNRKWWKMF